MITYYRNLDLHWWQFIKRAYRRNLYTMMNEAYWRISAEQLMSEQRGISGSTWDGVIEDISEICADIENGMGHNRVITIT